MAAVRVGIDTVAGLVGGGVDLIGTGEMGIGNSTAAAAIVSALTGLDPADVVGPGTGLDAAGVRHKADVVRRALDGERPRRGRPAGRAREGRRFRDRRAGGSGHRRGGSRRAGGRGRVHLRVRPPWWRCGWRRRPLRGCSPRTAAPSPGIASCSTRSALTPVLELDMRLGEGTGAALAMELIDAACVMMSGMATFAEAGVSDREE